MGWFSHIDVEATLPGDSLIWRCTGFYGWADHSQRLRHLANQRNLPWIVGGDFNEILPNEEKVGGGDMSQYVMMNFREALRGLSSFRYWFRGRCLYVDKQTEAP